MNALVSRNPSVALVNNQATTTSTAVAEYFGKMHKHVLRAIDNLECPAEYRALNFGLTFQVIEMPNGAKREERIFTLTRDGFALLAMGFTGKEAMQWKIAYLEAFNKMEAALKWGADYPPIVQSWRRNWARIIPFFEYPPEIRKVIYTTNAIESVNMSLRKITKNWGSFPSDEALLKLFYLALKNISKKWTMPIQNWKAALNRFTIQFEDRMPQQ